MCFNNPKLVPCGEANQLQLECNQLQEGANQLEKACNQLQVECNQLQVLPRCAQNLHPTHLDLCESVFRVGSLCLTHPELVSKHPTHLALSVLEWFV